MLIFPDGTKHWTREMKEDPKPQTPAPTKKLDRESSIILGLDNI
jgi:hypothetical protein